MNLLHNIDDESRPPTSTEWVGIALLWFGAGMITLSVWNQAAELPFEMPSFWYRHQTLWGFIGMAAFILGAALVKKPVTRPLKLRWRPGQLGQRFQKIEVYTKDECPLCEEALVVIEDYSDYLPRCEVRDIASNPEWQAAYADKVPVVVCDGKVRFRGRINEVLLRRLIEGTPPISP